MENERAIERLAFIKNLYSIGVEQSKREEPLCWMSILTFHDAVELFLALASEHLDLDVRLRDIKFMEYWSLLSKILKEKGKGELTQRISMEKLNKARVDFKHYGNPPSRSVIEDFRASTMNFLDENTRVVFDVEFSEISLVELVKYEAAKKSLKEAREMLGKNEIENSLDKTALAFAQLTDDYETRKMDEFGRSPFFFGEEMYFLSSFSMEIRGRLGDFIDKTKESVEALQEAVKILSLGLDYKRYARFRLLTPHVERVMNGTYHIVRIQRGSRGLPTVEEVQFCIDFVIESAIALQEFDFSLEEQK